MLKQLAMALLPALVAPAWAGESSPTHATNRSDE